MDYSRLMKFSPLIGIYAFYNVFATSAPADPLTAMKNALTAFVSDPLTKLKAKTSNLTTLAIVILGVPMLTQALRLPTALKTVVKLITYYIIGDQVAAILNGPGRFGAQAGWGGATSAYHQHTPVMGASYSQNYMNGRR